MSAMWKPQSMPPYEASWPQEAVPAEEVAGTDRLIRVIAAAGATTTTVAMSLFEASAADVATTWYVPPVAGAVYLPVESTAPPAPPSCTDQVTAVLEEPVTLAEKRALPLSATEAVLGEMETATAAALVTVTVAT